MRLSVSSIHFWFVNFCDVLQSFDLVIPLNFVYFGKTVSICVGYPLSFKLYFILVIVKLFGLIQWLVLIMHLVMLTQLVHLKHFVANLSYFHCHLQTILHTHLQVIRLKTFPNQFLLLWFVVSILPIVPISTLLFNYSFLLLLRWLTLLFEHFE